MDKIKVLLVDDQALVREAIAFTLARTADIQIVGSLSSGEELMSKIRNLNPDVIIMDVVLRGMSGIEATRWVKERNSKLKVLLLVTHLTKEMLSEAIQCNVDGCVTRGEQISDLVEAIRRVQGGDKYFNESVVNLVFDDFYHRERTAAVRKKFLDHNDLSKRELEVLNLVVAGKSNTDIAHQLGISAKTVNTHKTHILEKLGLSNTTELVKYAIKNELTSI
jgi:DNA-binding NarL/FixJ family response regulator